MCSQGDGSRSVEKASSGEKKGKEERREERGVSGAARREFATREKEDGEVDDKV